MVSVRTYWDNNRFVIMVDDVDDEERERLARLVADIHNIKSATPIVTNFEPVITEPAPEFIPEDETGSGMTVIPEGEHVGLTIKEIFSIEGHKGLVQTMCNIGKMNVSREVKDSMLKDAMRFCLEKQLCIDTEYGIPLTYGEYRKIYEPFLKQCKEYPEIPSVEDTPPKNTMMWYKNSILLICERLENALKKIE